MVNSQSFICISSFPCLIRTQHLMDICRYMDISTCRRQNLNSQHRCQCTNAGTTITAAKQNQNNCWKKIPVLKFPPALPRQDPALAGLWVLDNSEHALEQESSFSYACVSTRKCICMCAADVSFDTRALWEHKMKMHCACSALWHLLTLPSQQLWKSNPEK